MINLLISLEILDKKMLELMINYLKLIEITEEGNRKM